MDFLGITGIFLHPLDDLNTLEKECDILGDIAGKLISNLNAKALATGTAPVTEKIFLAKKKSAEELLSPQPRPALLAPPPPNLQEAINATVPEAEAPGGEDLSLIHI